MSDRDQTSDRTYVVHADEITAKGATIAFSATTLATGRLVMRCEAPAPLVANGAPFVGCSKEKGHNDEHEVVVRWRQ